MWRYAQSIGVALVVLAACTRPQDEVPAENTYRAFKHLEGAIQVGVNKPSYDNLLREAAAEIIILADLVAGTSDTTVHERYRSALAAYKDAGTLWDEQIGDARYDWIPSGRIYTLHPDIVARYNLQTTSHKMPYSGTTFETVGKESIQIIWETARPLVDSADALIIHGLQKRYR